MKYRSGLEKGLTAGRSAFAQISDRSRYFSAGAMTPAHLSRIFASANSGDTEALCLAGREIMEKNWDIASAFAQRCGALSGSKWEVLPGDDSPRACEAANAFRRALEDAGSDGESETFEEMTSSLLDAVILPFSASEILWKPGGSFQGFNSIEPHNFTLRDSFEPLLVTDEHPEGMILPKHKFIIHFFRRRSDPARAGLIRSLAWLHCFQNWPMKDLFSFIERFGMPFVVAKVDKNTWENDREILKSVIRSFGPEGGGVFNSSTEVQLLSAANTGGDNVYFHALEFCHNAIYTLIVGQLASSSDSSGMSNGDAQSAVRQDLLEADARAIERTIRSQLASPFTRFLFGEGTPVPKLHFLVEKAEDQAKLAQIVSTLSQAGFKADASELSERFGMKLRYEAPAAPSAGFAMSSEPGAEAGKINDAMESSLREWLGPLAEELNAITDENISDDEFKERLAACAEGKKNGSSENFEHVLEEQIYDGIAHGVTK